MKNLIFLILILFLLSNFSLIEGTDSKDVCKEVYFFILQTGGEFKYTEVDQLNLRLGINDSEGYIRQFNERCSSYFGVLDEDFIQAYNNYNQSCSLNTPSFFQGSVKVRGYVYLGDFKCGTQKWIDYFVDVNNGQLKGIRFWLVIPFVILLTVVFIWIRRRRKR